jgi:Sulfotransferase domain
VIGGACSLWRGRPFSAGGRVAIVAAALEQAVRGVREIKILCAGLSKTGTMSLHMALKELGYTSLHWDRERLNDALDGSNPNPDFRIYDDYDAVSDIPSAFFYRELLEAYPEAKVILTVRDVEAWWKSIEYHFNIRAPYRDPVMLRELARTRPGSITPAVIAGEVLRERMRNIVYGSPVAREFMYKKRYVEHNERVVADVPAERLLLMDVTEGDGWEKLCPFLGAPVLPTPFPHHNKGGPNDA